MSVLGVAITKSDWAFHTVTGYKLLPSYTVTEERAEWLVLGLRLGYYMWVSNVAFHPATFHLAFHAKQSLKLHVFHH